MVVCKSMFLLTFIYSACIPLNHVGVPTVNNAVQINTSTVNTTTIYKITKTRLKIKQNKILPRAYWQYLFFSLDGTSQSIKRAQVLVSCWKKSRCRRQSQPRKLFQSAGVATNCYPPPPPCLYISVSLLPPCSPLSTRPAVWLSY